MIYKTVTRLYANILDSHLILDIKYIYILHIGYLRYVSMHDVFIDNVSDTVHN